MISDLGPKSTDHDIHAHFALRLLFASILVDNVDDLDVEEACQWLVWKESQLFRCRLHHRILSSTPPQHQEEVAAAHMDITQRGLNALDVSYATSCDDPHYLLVPFQDVPTLVRTRSVDVRHGMCHIHKRSNEMIEVVTFHVQNVLTTFMIAQQRACSMRQLNMDQLACLKQKIMDKYRQQRQQWQMHGRHHHHSPHANGTSTSSFRVRCASTLEKVEHCLP
jgi:hypothetical protein